MPGKRSKKATPASRGRPPSTPVPSRHTTPLSSAYPSTCAPDAENDISKIPLGALTLSDPSGTMTTEPQKKERKPFRFLDLPAELRTEVYLHYFGENDRVIDLDSDNYKHIHKQLGILRTCRTIYCEASPLFYGKNVFRIFPTQPGRFFKTKKPLLARLNAGQRRSLTSLELRLGPGWNKPPRGWVVNSALGLPECVNVHKLAVLIECDPSDKVFQGFRKADGFYEMFSRNLLDDVLAELPKLKVVQFDAWSSVKKSGAMMTGLLEVAKARGKQICWGPERKWTDDDEEVEAHFGTAVAFPHYLG